MSKAVHDVAGSDCSQHLGECSYIISCAVCYRKWMLFVACILFQKFLCDHAVFACNCPDQALVGHGVIILGMHAAILVEVVIVIASATISIALPIYLPFVDDYPKLWN